MNAPRRDYTASSGFVLVGVLMFILVLTILGLTLFSLASFESQFYYDSLDHQRAFYSAVGGIERAKFVLSTTGKLPDARNLSGAPITGLTYTVAKQGTDFASADSSGAVDWKAGNKPVWIRTVAVINSQRAMVEAQFTPHRGVDYYKRLATLSDPLVGLLVISTGGAGANKWSAAGQVSLSGGVWQNSVVPGWLFAAQYPSPTDLSGGVPTPDVNGYLARFWNSAIEMPRDPNDIYDLNATAANPTGNIAFWKSSYSAGYDANHYWSLDGNPGTSNPPNAVITVHGVCVWMFDHGVHFNRHVLVTGTGGADDALVIVAHPGSDIKETNLPALGYRGIALNQPLFSSNSKPLANKDVVADPVPVILVSDGGVGDENTEDPNATSAVDYLSVFAQTCGLIGPFPGGHGMYLTHDPNAPQDVPVTGLIDRLTKKGYLPNTSAGGSDFTPILGTWRQITDSDPIN